MSGFQQVLNVRFGGCQGGCRGSVSQGGTDARSTRSGRLRGGVAGMTACPLGSRDQDAPSEGVDTL